MLKDLLLIQNCLMAIERHVYYDKHMQLIEKDKDFQAAKEAVERVVKERMCIDRMKTIGELIRSQDNRATDAPLFIVQKKERIYGFDPSYSDNYVWLDTGNDCYEATSEEAIELDRKEDNDEDLDGWVKTAYQDRWEFVTACFTEQGCKDYITINGHNLGETRIYAEGSYRNEEFRAVRKFLMELG